MPRRSRMFTTALCVVMFAVLSWDVLTPRTTEAADDPRAEADAPTVFLDRGGPERTGSISGSHLPAHPAVLWTTLLPADPGEPLLAEGEIYVGASSGALYSINLKDGLLRWRFVGHDQIFGAPAVRGDTVYVTSRMGLRALSRANGRLLWNVGLVGDATGSSPLVMNDRIIVADTTGKVSAVDFDGKVIWQHDIVADAPPSPPGFGAERARGGGNGKARPGTAASDGATIFLPIFDQSRIAAIDLKAGRRHWSFQAKGWIFATPALDHERVYFGSQDNSFYCLDKRRKTLLWSFPTKSRIEAEPAVQDGSVYFGSCDGRFYRVNARTGKEVWRYETPITEGSSRALYSGPIVTEDAVYFGSFDGHLYCLGIDKGELRWRIAAAGRSEITGGVVTDGRRIVLAVRRSQGGRGQNAIVAIGEADSRKSDIDTP